MKRILLLAAPLASVLMSTSLSAQTTAAPVAPCRDAPARQFDFWLGSWDVLLPDGSRAGGNRIEAVAGGCALLEHWQGRGGFTGHSLNRYDAASGRWQQWWVDSSGSLLQLSGGWQDGRMVLSGETVEGAQRRLERISWTPLADGAVRQLWEQSTDGGRQWTVAFDGRYVRQRPAP